MCSELECDRDEFFFQQQKKKWTGVTASHWAATQDTPLKYFIKSEQDKRTAQQQLYVFTQQTLNTERQLYSEQQMDALHCCRQSSLSCLIPGSVSHTCTSMWQTSLCPASAATWSGVRLLWLSSLKLGSIPSTGAWKQNTHKVSFSVQMHPLLTNCKKGKQRLLQYLKYKKML